MKLLLRAGAVTSVAVLGVALLGPVTGSYAKNGSDDVGNSSNQFDDDDDDKNDDKGGRQNGKKKNRSIKTGACSNAASWKLKVKPDDGGLEVEFEVDSNRAGEVWSVRLNQNGNRVFTGSDTTEGRSGSFDIEVDVADQVGKDRFRAVAKRGSAKCVGTLNF